MAATVIRRRRNAVWRQAIFSDVDGDDGRAVRALNVRRPLCAPSCTPGNGSTITRLPHEGPRPGPTGGTQMAVCERHTCIMWRDATGGQKTSCARAAA